MEERLEGHFEYHPRKFYAEYNIVSFFRRKQRGNSRFPWIRCAAVFRFSRSRNLNRGRGEETGNPERQDRSFIRLMGVQCFKVSQHSFFGIRLDIRSKPAIVSMIIPLNHIKKVQPKRGQGTIRSFFTLNL